MGFRDRKRSSSNKNDKYLRLTGLWQSKNNDLLWSGRLKTEQIEALLKKVEEAMDQDAPLIFGLWENDKKESKKDPEFTLQCFVGDSEESPRSSRGSSSSSSSRRDRDRDRDDDKDDKDEKEEGVDDKEKEEEEDEKPRKKSTRKEPEPASKGKSKKADW